MPCQTPNILYQVDNGVQAVFEAPSQMFGRVLNSSFGAPYEISYRLEAKLKIEENLIVVLTW